MTLRGSVRVWGRVLFMVIVRVLFRARLGFSIRVRLRVCILLIQMAAMTFQPEFDDHRKHSLGIFLMPRHKHSHCLSNYHRIIPTHFVMFFFPGQIKACSLLSILIT